MRNISGHAPLAVALLAGIASAQPAFRPPFVLKLHIDNEHYYEEAFDKIPYVAENNVYLFAGETFGINVAITENQAGGTEIST